MTGLFFGSFNPIHIGHMLLANYMLSYEDLDEIWFVVSPHNPLKEKKTLLSDNQRLYMVNLAVEDLTGMRSSNIEFHLSQPSYTIHTMAALDEKYPNKKFSLIMGADNITNIHKWKNYELLLEKYPILVYPRKGENELETIIKELPTNRIKITQAPVIEISSTFIRNSIKSKKDITCFLPSKVHEYITEMNLYKK
jgi:nicotinate-nucleotide adenylyltransferase